MIWKREGELFKTLVRVLLYSIGIFESKTWSILYSSVYTICLIVGLWGSAIGFFNTRGINGRIESSAIFCIAAAHCFMYVASLTSKDKIKKLLFTLKSDYACSQDIVQHAGEFAMGKISFLMSVYLLLTFLFVLPSFNVILIFQDEFSVRSVRFRENLGVIPHWYSCGSSEHHRIIKSFCWEVETRREFLLKNFIELAFCIVEYFASIFCIVLYCIVMAEFYVHMKIFESKVNSLVQYGDWFAVQYHHIRIDVQLKSIILEGHYEVMIDHLRSIIKYQQFLKRCVREINDAFETFNNVLIAEYFAALIFVVLMVFYKSDNTMLFKCIPLFIHEVFSLFLLCYFAQIISESNETIFCALSKLPWYGQDVRFRKIYSIVLTQNNVPARAKLFNTHVLNLQFLLTTFKSLYSILNLLLLEIAK